MAEREVKTERLRADRDGISRAAKLLRAGGLVSFATETVYGLGADATNDRAVARIFEAKGRPRFNPLIVHLPSLDEVPDYAILNGVARDLAQAFWPGPLTLVLPLKVGSNLSELVSAGLETVAIRVPAHPLAQRLLNAAGVPVAAPSANPSGRISPSTARHVLEGLDGKIDAVLDGGACGVGVESTIVGIEPTPMLLRPGGLPVEVLEQALAGKIDRGPHSATSRMTSSATQDATKGDSSTIPAAITISAPGQMQSHYAPRAKIRLNAVDVLGGERLLGFGPVKARFNLSPSGDLVEAAANLFKMLHLLDAQGEAPIAVSPIPDHGLGCAINDRLKRAAAPRPV